MTKFFTKQKQNLNNKWLNFFKKMKSQIRPGAMLTGKNSWNNNEKVKMIK